MARYTMYAVVRRFTVILIGVLMSAVLAAAEETAPTPTPTPAPEATELINLNTAAPEELQTLPGIGEKTAAAIVENRPYAEVDDLLKVKGIGEKKLAKIRPLVTVAPDEAANDNAEPETNTQTDDGTEANPADPPPAEDPVKETSDSASR